MALADAAVEMGPRNRRRLTKGAITLGVVGAIVAAAVLLTRPANQSGPGLSAGSTRGIGNGVPSTPVIDKIEKLSFGMTKQQVRHRMGPPTKVVGHCWQYAVNEISWTRHQGKIYLGGTVNAERLCFGYPGGVYASSRVEINGSWLHPAGRATLPGS